MSQLITLGGDQETNNLQVVEVEHKSEINAVSFDEDEAIIIERLQRAQWLRAAILGANDGLLSTTAIMLGMGAAKEDGRDMLLSGLAGALAGAFSMAVGEFVSVCTQRDIEKATARRSTTTTNTYNYTTNGSSSSRKDDDINHVQAADIEPGNKYYNAVASPEEMSSTGKEGDRMVQVLANPYKAAVASGLAFLSGASVPLVSAIFVGGQAVRMMVMIGVSSMALALFGCVGAHLGGTPIRVSAARVVVGGWAAMAITYGLLKPFNAGDPS